MSQQKASVIKALNNVVEYYRQTLSELGDVSLAIPIKITLDNLQMQNVIQPIQREQSPESMPSQNLSTQHISIQKPSVEQAIQITQSMQQKPVIEKPKENHKEKVSPAVNLNSITTLEELKEEVEKSCACELKAYATKTVFGDGNPLAKILVVGEAPGQEEDLAGVPFIGRSGELLMNAFASINLDRKSNFYITNNIFWRPPGNRKPTEEEMDICRPYLTKIIDIIKPEVIICVGSVAAQNVLSSEETISSMRNRKFTEAKTLGYTGQIFAIYHPSYLLRNPSKKYDMYKDLLYIKENIGELL